MGTGSSRVSNLLCALVMVLLSLLAPGAALSNQLEIRFLIPGGAGGGWDTTARTVGETLEATGLATVTEYEHLEGSGGGRAVLSMIHHPSRYRHTLMVHSTPIIVRSLSGEIQYDWREVIPVATLISAYQAIAVPADSPYRTIEELLSKMRSAPGSVPVAGGSAILSLDHLTLGLIAKAAGIDLQTLRYSPADGGREALDRMLSGQVKAVVSGVGELMPAVDAGKIRILGVTSANPIKGVAAPTLRSQGLDVVFANWRGFFAAPGQSEAEIDRYRTVLVRLAKTPEWEEVRMSHNWEPLVLTGKELTDFLRNQERALGEILSELGQ